MASIRELYDAAFSVLDAFDELPCLVHGRQLDCDVTSTLANLRESAAVLADGAKSFDHMFSLVRLKVPGLPSTVCWGEFCGVSWLAITRQAVGLYLCGPGISDAAQIDVFRVFRGLLGGVGHLRAELTAELNTIRALNEIIERAKETDADWVAAKGKDGPWSEPDGPTQWARKFGFSQTTLMRRFEEGIIRHKKYSSKSYAIHVDDLPKTANFASGSRQ